MSLDKAIAYAVRVHHGQKDKGGASYILHPIAVMRAVSHLGEDAMAVGVLHDSIEDDLEVVTQEAVDDRLIVMQKELSLSDGQVRSLRLLTHTDGVPYGIYVNAMRDDVVATAVKIADLEHNMDIRRIKNRRDMQQKDLDRLAKYLSAWTTLTGK